jgi:hypothetical protein
MHFCRNNVLILRQISDLLNMESTENQLLSRVSKRGRSTIVFSADFTSIGTSKAIGKALERLTNDGKLIRVARGIYCYPKIDKVLGLGAIYPTVEEVVAAIAKRDRARVVPTGIQAMNKLGLTTQIPMNHVYLTDGSGRKIVLDYGGTIHLKRVAPKNLAFTNEIAMLVTFALKELGQNKVTEEQQALLKAVLRKEKKESVLVDARLMPVWIRDFIKNAYE